MTNSWKSCVQGVVAEAKGERFLLVARLIADHLRHALRIDDLPRRGREHSQSRFVGGPRRFKNRDTNDGGLVPNL